MKTITIIFIGVALLYTIACVFLYFVQEKLLFSPTVLPNDYEYKFDYPFDEINLKTTKHINLNYLLFKTQNSKGIVLFFHGNGGAIDSWGHKQTFT